MSKKKKFYESLFPKTVFVFYMKVFFFNSVISFTEVCFLKQFCFVILPKNVLLIILV